jgi:hypothetical protein
VDMSTKSEKIKGEKKKKKALEIEMVVISTISSPSLSLSLSLSRGYFFHFTKKTVENDNAKILSNGPLKGKSLETDFEK